MLRKEIREGQILTMLLAGGHHLPQQVSTDIVIKQTDSLQESRMMQIMPLKAKKWNIEFPKSYASSYYWRKKNDKYIFLVSELV